MGKHKKNLPQEFSVSERGEDIDERTRGSKVATIAGASFFTISAAVSIFLIVFTIVFFFSRVLGPSMMLILNADFYPGHTNTDAVIVNRFRTPQINDIIVTRFYRDTPPPSHQAYRWQQSGNRWFQLYIKRLIAVGGDRIFVERDSVDNDLFNLYVNGTRFVEHRDVDLTHWGQNRDDPRWNYFTNFHNVIHNIGNYRNHTHNQPWAHMVDDSNPLRPELVIPSTHIFYMGDNRLESLDGRHFGPQPASWVVGVAVNIARNNQSLPAWLWSRFVHYITFQWV